MRYDSITFSIQQIYLFDCSGAETAMRDLNGRTNSLLNIRVEFAFPRRQEDQPIMELPKSQYPVEDQPKFPPMRPPIFVNFDVPYDNVFEKITDFERKPISMSSAQVRRREFMLKMANESISSYDSETVSDENLMRWVGNEAT